MTAPRRSLASVYLASVLLAACSAQVSGGGSGSGGSTGAGAGTSGQGAAGTSGPAGHTGGAAGTLGTTGVAGTTGTTGVAGTNGTAGHPGGAGTTGAAGTSGAAGTTGTTGLAGTTGTTGVAGTIGTTDGGITAVDLTGRKALLLVDSPSSPSDGETLLQQVLQERGMVVTIGASTGPASLATGQNVIVVSDSAGAGDFVPVFGTATIPMIVFGNSAFQTLGWTPTSSSKGTVDGTTSVTMLSPTTQLSSDLAGGASFTMIIASQNDSLYWGSPGGKPIAVTSVMGSATELIDFAYEAGTATATGTAPARRVGLGWKTSALQDLTINGFKLFSAALDWTAGSN
jgi:collagen type VII alpha